MSRITYGRRWGWEDKLLMDDVIFSERNDEEDAKESATDGEGQELAEVLLRKFGEEAKAIHGGYATDKDNSQTARGCRSTKFRFGLIMS